MIRGFAVPGICLLRNRAAGVFRKVAGSKDDGKMLYFYAHDYEYMKKNLPPFQLKVWRSVSVPWMKVYIHSWLGGHGDIGEVISAGGAGAGGMRAERGSIRCSF